ncbi:TetR/AcrR family transcriptional regulator [Zhihengliuella flava]|uniref:AcrR family transcriptional regulator n=1 Tax=Zhihengliuella flava TaxID=1285193 RepID=A0A931D5J2_9MICC|nr:TetR/AcrR family transcriptional regulator [Zhihengliuella flava]MBG6084809.1 AcrR family transcriptional regulator [Zhihengliuella flava]
MSESASSQGARERRRQATHTALVDHARRLTAEHGLSGFTVEELAEAADVSRRTFFNYFQTKEDAVLGVGSEDLPLATDSAFVDSADPLPAALKDLFLRRFPSHQRFGHDVAIFMELLHSETALMRRMMQINEQRRRDLAALIARRESLPDTDPFALAAAGFSGHLLMTSLHEFVSEEHADPPSSSSELTEEATRARFAHILEANFAHAERLFAPASPRSKD